MKPEYVVDTHALIWHLQNLSELSLKIRELFSQIDAGKARAIAPTIVLVEMIYLAEKGRISEDLLKSALRLLGMNSENYQLAPLDFAVVESLQRIPYSIAPDMPDRLIAATALALNLPLISRDSAMANLPEIEVIW